MSACMRFASKVSSSKSLNVLPLKYAAKAGYACRMARPTFLQFRAEGQQYDRARPSPSRARARIRSDAEYTALTRAACDTSNQQVGIRRETSLGIQTACLTGGQ